MNKTNYISVGIDVGSSFSFMSIVDINEQVILKPFKSFIMTQKKQKSQTP